MQEEAQRQAELARYNDELARQRMSKEHDLQRQRNAELVRMQEEAAARKESERLRIEQQIQAERRAADQYAVCAVVLGCAHSGLVKGVTSVPWWLGVLDWVVTCTPLLAAVFELQHARGLPVAGGFKTSLTALAWLLIWLSSHHIMAAGRPSEAG